jgi:hypothetical protein
MIRRSLSGRAARAGSLLALGALAVHQLRYLLTYGSGADKALAHQGHGYLLDLVPTLVVLALCVLLGRLLASRLGRMRPGGPPRLRRSALAFSLALLATFALQELLEGMLAAGHPGGAAAVLANGGWLAIPLSFVLGSVAALCDRLLAGAERVLGLQARGRRPRLRPRPAPTPAVPPAARPLATLALAFGLARRPPPPRLA